MIGKHWWTVQSSDVMTLTLFHMIVTVCSTVHVVLLVFFKMIKNVMIKWTSKNNDTQVIVMRVQYNCIKACLNVWENGTHCGTLA